MTDIEETFFMFWKNGGPFFFLSAIKCKIHTKNRTFVYFISNGMHIFDKPVLRFG